MSKAHDAVTKRMAQKIDADKLYMASHEDLHAKLTIELAIEIERAKDLSYAVVSMVSQREAAAYFNEHGFVLALDHMLDMRDANDGKAETP